MNSDENAVAAVLTRYEKALNESDTDEVMKLYAPDGVFMAQNFPSSVGANAVRKDLRHRLQNHQAERQFQHSRGGSSSTAVGICAN